MGKKQEVGGGMTRVDDDDGTVTVLNIQMDFGRVKDGGRVERRVSERLIWERDEMWREKGGFVRNEDAKTRINTKQFSKLHSNWKLQRKLLGNSITMKYICY